MVREDMIAATWDSLCREGKRRAVRGHYPLSVGSTMKTTSSSDLVYDGILKVEVRSKIFREH